MNTKLAGAAVLSLVLSMGCGPTAEPDMIISDITIHSWDTNSIELTVSIKNDGTGTANTSADLYGDGSLILPTLVLDLRLSEDSTYDEEVDTELNGDPQPWDFPDLSIAAGEELSRHMVLNNVVIDPNTLPYVVGKIDELDSVVESNEDNNSAFAVIE